MESDKQVEEQTVHSPQDKVWDILVRVEDMKQIM